MASALKEYIVLGVKTNLGFLIRVMQNDEFKKAEIDTGFIERHPELLTPMTDDIESSLIAAAICIDNFQEKGQDTGTGKPTSNWKIFSRRLGVSRNMMI
jgi:pyruvate carboxylase